MCLRQYRSPFGHSVQSGLAASPAQAEAALGVRLVHCVSRVCVPKPDQTAVRDTQQVSTDLLDRS